MSKSFYFLYFVEQLFVAPSEIREIKHMYEIRKRSWYLGTGD